MGSGSDENNIIGMKSLCAHMGLNTHTMRKLIQTEGFPAAKVMGTWYSEKSLISDWVRSKVREGCQGKNRDKIEAITGR